MTSLFSLALDNCHACLRVTACFYLKWVKQSHNTLCAKTNRRQRLFRETLWNCHIWSPTGWPLMEIFMVRLYIIDLKGREGEGLWVEVSVVTKSEKEGFTATQIHTTSLFTHDIKKEIHHLLSAFNVCPRFLFFFPVPIVLTFIFFSEAWCHE